MIPLRTHALLDYTLGAFLILAPFAFGLLDLDPARNVFILSGAFLILYSVLTDYEISAIPTLPVGLHLILDIGLGILLAVAPWVFDYRDFLTSGQESLHYLVGLGVFALVGLTGEKAAAPNRRQTAPLRTFPSRNFSSVAGRL